MKYLLRALVLLCLPVGTGLSSSASGQDRSDAVTAPASTAVAALQTGAAQKPSAQTLPVTVHLRNGASLKGEFVQADTSFVVVVAVDGRRRTFRVEEVARISFDAGDAGESPQQQAAAPSVPEERSAPARPPAGERLSPEAERRAREAVRTLRQMGSAVQGRLSFQEYNSRLISIKPELEDALSLLPEGALRDELRLAVDAYADAAQAWSRMRAYAFLLATFEPGRSLQEKYSIPLSRGHSQRAMSREIVLSTIWRAARAHTERASAHLR